MHSSTDSTVGTTAPLQCAVIGARKICVGLGPCIELRCLAHTVAALLSDPGSAPSDMLSMTLRPPYASACGTSAKQGAALRAASIHLRLLTGAHVARVAPFGLHLREG